MMLLSKIGDQVGLMKYWNQIQYVEDFYGLNNCVPKVLRLREINR